MPFPSRFSRSLIAAGLALAAGWVATVPARAQGFDAKQKAEIEALVRDYILKNPEIIRDAMMELDRRQREAEKQAQRTALLAQRAQLFENPSSIVIGNPKGDVTVVEFFDYNCGYCKRSLTDIQELIKSDPRVKVVLKDFPILGPDSVDASKLAVAAKAQLTPERYLDFHSRLMASKGRVGKEKALEVAAEMKLDLAKLQADAEGPTVKDFINGTLELAETIGVNGTPAFVVGDEVIAGAVGLAPIRRVVTALRQCGKATC